MQFSSPLLSGTLLRRYQRFLADVRLDDGTEVTAHCPNSGSLLGAKEPGLRVWVSQVPESSPRKLRYTWELVELDNTLVCINTQHPNEIINQALINQQIPEFQHIKNFRREVKYGLRSRIDFFLEDTDGIPWYLEVKSVHMKIGAQALFPDSVTERGAKQVRELMPLLAVGAKATVLYLIQRHDTQEFTLARSLDPVYAQVMADAHERGLQSLAYACHVNTDRIDITERIPIL